MFQTERIEASLLLKRLNDDFLTKNFEILGKFCLRSESRAPQGRDGRSRPTAVWLPAITKIQLCLIHNCVMEPSRAAISQKRSPHSEKLL